MSFSISGLHFVRVQSVEARVRNLQSGNHCLTLFIRSQDDRKDEIKIFGKPEMCRKIAEVFPSAPHDQVWSTPGPGFHNPHLLSVSKNLLKFEEFTIALE